jgi:hypothetical protein
VRFQLPAPSRPTFLLASFQDPFIEPYYYTS